MLVLTLQGDAWNDLYALSGVTVGQTISIQVQTSTRLFLSESATAPLEPKGIEAAENEWYTFSSASLGAWVYPLNGNAQVLLLVSTDKALPYGSMQRMTLLGRTLDRIATQALNYRDDAIQRGLGYYAYTNQNIAAGAKVYIRFVCPVDKYVVLIGRDIIMNKESMVYRAYTAFTGGTVGAAITIRNLRSDTAFPATSTVNIMTGTTPTAGTDVTNLPIYGAVGTGNRVSGGSDSADTFRLLAPSSIYLIELDNTSTSANSVYTQFTWYELSSQVVL